MSKFIKSFYKATKTKDMVPFIDEPDYTPEEVRDHILSVVKENKYLLIIMFILLLIIKML